MLPVLTCAKRRFHLQVVVKTFRITTTIKVKKLKLLQLQVRGVATGGIWGIYTLPKSGQVNFYGVIMTSERLLNILYFPQKNFHTSPKQISGYAPAASSKLQHLASNFLAAAIKLTRKCAAPKRCHTFNACRSVGPAVEPSTRVLPPQSSVACSSGR